MDLRYRIGFAGSTRLSELYYLSGYDEFEYAQRAIKLDIDEYILKPFDAEQIVQVLNKVKDRLDVEIARRKDMELLRKHYLTSLPVLRETFLISLLSRKLPISQIVEKARGYELDLKGKQYVVSAVSLEQDPELAGAEDPLTPSSSTPSSGKGSLRESGDIDLQLFAVWNIAEELWNGHKLGKAFIYQNHVVLLTLSENEDAAAVLKGTLEALQDIVVQIERFLKLTVTIGVGGPVKLLTDLKYGYEDALHALDYRVIQSTQRVIYMAT